jgi:hypothetical protein
MMLGDIKVNEKRKGAQQLRITANRGQGIDDPV